MRSHTGYCNEEIMRLIDQQPRGLDAKTRREVVAEIEKRLERNSDRGTDLVTPPETEIAIRAIECV